jgi:hypothetical protein
VDPIDLLRGGREDAVARERPEGESARAIVQGGAEVAREAVVLVEVRRRARWAGQAVRALDDLQIRSGTDARDAALEGL